MIKKRKAQFFHYKKLLLGDKDYRELLHGTGVSAIFTIVGMGLGYVVTILSARWFGADGMGLMAMINTIIVFGGAIAGLGIQGSVVRYVNQWRAQGVEGKIKTLHGFILKTVFPFSIIIAILLYLGKGRLAHTVFNEPRLEQLIVWLALCFPLIVVGTIGLEIIKGYKKLTVYHSLNKVGKAVIKLLVICVVRYTTGTLYGPAYALLLSLVVSALLAFPFLRKYYRSIKNSDTISNRGILATSLPMMVTSISAILMNQTDIVMLGMLTETQTVGIYISAYRLAQLIPFGLLMVNMIIGQKIAQLYRSDNKQKLQSIMKLSAIISLFSGLLIGIILILFAQGWMGLFGKEFIIGALLLQVLAIGQLINVSAGSVGIYMNMTGKQNVLQVVILITALINIGLNAVLIPIHGAVGAAIASALSLIIWNVYMVVYIYKKDGIRSTLF